MIRTVTMVMVGVVVAEEEVGKLELLLLAVTNWWRRRFLGSFATSEFTGLRLSTVYTGRQCIDN